MLKTKVNEMLLKLSILDEIHEGQQLQDDLGLDSLSLTELMVGLEEAFAIELSMDDLDPSNFSTVDDIYKLMEKYVTKEVVGLAV